MAEGSRVTPWAFCISNQLMADPNRLELVISIKDDGSAGAESIKSRYKSIVDDANNLGLALDRSLQRLGASAQRSVDAYIRQASTAGLTPVQKIYAREAQLLKVIGDDQSKAAQDVRAGTQNLVNAYEQRAAAVTRAREAADRAAATKSQGIAAGRATLPGEAEFQTAFARVKDRDQLVRDLEQRASIAGKKPSERLAMEMKSTLAAFANAPEEAKKVEGFYKTIVDAAKKAEAEAGGHGVGSQALRRGVLAVKDAAEGSTRGFLIELTDIFVGTSGSGGVLPAMAAGITNITGLSSGAVLAIGGLTAAFAGLGIAGLVSAHSLAETGQKIKDFSERTGIKPENVQHFQYAAKAEGVNPEVFEHAFRSLAQATDEDSTSGAKVRKELKDLHVDMYDQATGQLRPTENIMLDLAAAIQKLPPGLKASASSLEIFKRSGDGLLPVMLHLNENFAESQKMGGTFSTAKLTMFDDWHKEIVHMNEEWTRFKNGVETNLAVAATLTIHLINAGFSGGKEGAENLRTYGSPYASVIEPGINDELAKRGLFAPAPPKPPNPSESRKAHSDEVAFQRHKQEVAAFDTELMKDPHERLRRAQQELSETEKPDASKMQGPEVVRNYRAALQKVKDAQAASGRGGNREENKALQGVIAARNEGLRLDTEFAKQQFAEAEQLSRVELDSKNELATPEQTKRKLDAAFWAAQYETRDAIESRRKMIDTKTGQEVDLSNTRGFRESSRVEVQENLPKRIRDEQFKVLMEMAVNDAKYFKNRTDESMKHADEEWHRRQAGELELQDKIISLQSQIQDRRLQLDIEANDRQKNIAIEGLGTVHGQTLKDKMSLEDQKFAIEKEYADRGLALQLVKLDRDRAVAVGNVEKEFAAKGIPKTDEEVKKAVGLVNDEYDQNADALRQVTADKEKSDAMKMAKAKEDLQIQSNRKIYDSLKKDAAGLFDQLVSHTKSWADFAKDIFKSAILTPVKEIFSSQVAALFTGLITGNKVTFDPLGSGQGWLGRLEAGVGRAGAGQPNFHVTKATPFVQSKLEQPNHIGDVHLVNGAVRVVIDNVGQVGQAHAAASNAGIGATLANSFGSSILSGARRLHEKSLTESVTSAFIGGPDETAGSGTTGVSPHGFATMGEVASSLLSPDSLRGLFSAKPSPGKSDFADAASIKPDTHGIHISGQMPHDEEIPETFASLLSRGQKGFNNNWDLTYGFSALKRYLVDVPAEELGKAKDALQKGSIGLALGHGVAATPFAGLVSDMVADSQASAARAAKDFQGGQYLDGINHSLSVGLPLLGSMVDGTMDHLASQKPGDKAEGLGESIGLILPAVAPSMSIGGTALGVLLKSLESYDNSHLDQKKESLSPHGFRTLGDITALGEPQGIFASADTPFGLLPTPPPFVDPSLQGVQLADWTNANLGPEPEMAVPRTSGGFMSRLWGGNIQGTPPFLYPTDPRTGLPIDPGMTDGASGGASGQSGGGLSGISGIAMKGIMSPGGLKAFFGQNSLGTDIGGGVGIANTGMVGHLAAFGKSGAAGMIGGMLALDGLMRKPGKASAVETPLGGAMLGFKLGGKGGALIGAGAGLLADGLKRGGWAGVGEDTAGGALIGMQLGGPVGAAIGAAVGFGAGMFRKMFESDSDHAKKLVKQVYGMDINNATANSIIQIAKQSYGGQIDVAVRSQQVRDLLKLYSQATGQKSAEDQFAQSTIHGASLVEANGKLMQQAVYDNGNAYAYSSQLGTYQGVQTSPLSTYMPGQGVFSGNVQIHLNGQSAADVLEGRVVKTATPGFVQKQALAASDSSIGRASQTRMTLSPSAIPG